MEIIFGVLYQILEEGGKMLLTSDDKDNSDA
eukprot:CAMPEP_0194294834 /NCGR_PEP_ID=MMETSP0169-20130528/51812_1 /TAXON_ID=218684 /ORGANISM="Corethron pennatum, Strain L29A3" /LENGTH=30 /DNA_ID= /DNA_START= /DNA_END= /DNA_ORIENTATION=